MTRYHQRMRRLANLSAVVTSLVCSFALLAQWPKSSEAQPDPNGPAPTTADGRPDFSGVWTSGGPGGGKDGKDKSKDKNKDKAPPPFGKGKDKGPPPQAANGIPPGDFRNIGASFPGGLLPYQPAALALRNARLARNSADHPDAHCLPLNPIQLWFHPEPRKLIQTPRELVLLAEANSGTRQIFTDARALPNPADVQPWWYGYSVAKWDGDTLVVESTGFLDNAWIDENGSPLSNEARVTERIRRPNYGTLAIEITVNDPKTYTRPWTVTSLQRLLPNDELIEFVCAENNTSEKHLITQ
ncbi:MAG: hypothetical protein ABIR70_04740 [Bryobacteraceae bacterium]